MINFIFYDTDGHKVARRITSKEEYFAIRNGAKNREFFQKARESKDDDVKKKLAQFAYNDQLPDRVLKDCHTAASTFSHDIDCRSREECLEIAQRLIGMKSELQLLELSASANWGLHAVCLRQKGRTILENQIRFSVLSKTEMDCNAHDQQRVMFTGPADEGTLLYLDERIFEESMTVEEGQAEYQRLKERADRGEEQLPANYKKGVKHYRPWESEGETETSESTKKDTRPLPFEDGDTAKLWGYPVVDYLKAFLPSGAPKGKRHDTMLALARDLLIMLDNDDQQVRAALLALPWVQDVVKERGPKELEGIMDSSVKFNRKRESENFYPLQPSPQMQEAIRQVTGRSYVELTHNQESNLQELNAMLKRMGTKVKRMSTHFPLLKLLLHRAKVENYPAMMFAGGAYGMTLMTRMWYMGDTAKHMRLNSILEIIGRSGCGKSRAIDLYHIMLEPIKVADQQQIDALNQWNAEKEQKGGAVKNTNPKPQGIIRLLPSETSKAALRDAGYLATEEVDGEKIYLHLFHFNSELASQLSQQKKAYLDIEDVFFKSLGNEPFGGMLKTTTAMVGQYPLHFNGLYTGTYDALEMQITEENFSKGLLFRIVVIPMANTNFEMEEYHVYDQADQQRDQQLKQISYNLDKTKGMIDCSSLRKALDKWRAEQLFIAKEHNSMAEEDMLKRPQLHAINYALPFIVSRHWDQMVEDDTDHRWKCGAGFAIDRTDIALAQLIADIHLTFQKCFFLAVGENKYQHQQLKSRSYRHHTDESMRAYLRLPQLFTRTDVDREFGCNGNSNTIGSWINRLKKEGLIQKIRIGEDKGKYRKLE